MPHVCARAAALDGFAELFPDGPCQFSSASPVKSCFLALALSPLAAVFEALAQSLGVNLPRCSFAIWSPLLMSMSRVCFVSYL